MRKLLILLFSIVAILLGAQEESDISNIDIIESIEDINKKIDRLMPENRIEESNMEIGIIPITFRYFPLIDGINDYTSLSGTYDAFNSVYMPFVHGFEIFSNIKVKDAFLIGLNYYRYIQNTHGLHGSANSEVYDEAVSAPISDGIKSEDSNYDGIIDYYSYSNLFFTGVELSGTIKKSITPVLFFNVGPKVGYGYEEIEYASYERSMFADISPGDKVSWRRSNLILGGDLGLTYRYRSIAFVFALGFSYNLPLTEWSPVAGVSQSDNAPKDFNSMNIKISLGPVISLKL